MATNSKIDRIDALTALRFPAAVMIVVHHSFGHFGLVPVLTRWGALYLDHAVSFFFILSGFIMVYVYGDLAGTRARRRFIVSRFARLWPAHFLTGLLFLVFIFPHQNFVYNTRHILTIGANFLMLHSWLPQTDCFFSLNPPSWCIADEFFFYLVFPFLIINWRNAWPFKIAFSLLLVLMLVGVCHILRLPLNPPGTEPCIAGLVYVNPLARVFEFMVGMVTGHYWKNSKWSCRLPTVLATIIEMGLLLLLVAGVLCTDQLLTLLPSFVGVPGRVWLCHTCMFPVLALLIFFMAGQKGMVARLLNWKILVKLGEMSYALFLLHFVIIYIYAILVESSLSSQRLQDYVYFWVVLLVSSFLFWRFFEEPCRRQILSFYGRWCRN